MPKTFNTARRELVCGKIDELMDTLVHAGLISAIDVLKEIQHDCNRMEAGLVRRKDQFDQIRRNIEDLPPEFSKAIDDNFWQLT